MDPSPSPRCPFPPDGGDLLARGLEELGAGALLVLARSSHDPDLAPFVGAVHLGECFLVAPREGPARLAFLTPMEREEAAATGLELITPEDLEVLRFSRELGWGNAARSAVLARALELAGLAPGSLALAGNGEAGTLWAVGRALEEAGWSLLPAHHLTRLLRKRKDPRQLRDARRTAAGAATALRRVAELLAAAVERDGELWLAGERLTVGRLRHAVARELADCELEQPAGNLIAPGRQGAVPHTAGDPARVLRAGESLVVDLFPRGWLFADCTRTFCVGPPPEALVAAHDAVRAALDRAYSRITPERLASGLRGYALHDSVCALFRDRGYPTPISDPGTTRGYVHGLGHGVGFELHEYPSFRRQAGPGEGELETGDLFTLEPGLYEPEAGFAVRLEDLVQLGDDGPETLTPLPYALDPREW